MFSASERVLYGKRQLIEVICQLRFPTILSISAKEPAEFQEPSAPSSRAMRAIWKSSRPR